MRFSLPLTTIPGVEPSTEILARLRDEGRPVLLAFSRGKDAWAAALALEEAGIDFVPYHMHGPPDPDQPVKVTPTKVKRKGETKTVNMIRGVGRLRGLSFIEDSLAYCEQRLGKRIIRLVHPSFYRMLVNYVFQPPERCGIIDAAQIVEPTYEDMVDILRAELGLPPDTWVCDGVRAADSPMRRVAMASHGPVNFAQHKIHIVWDWRIAHVREAIAQRNVTLPVDYEMFDRTFDGVDLRFLEPLKERFPGDYAKILAWFPFADLFFFRETLTTPRKVPT